MMYTHMKIARYVIGITGYKTLDTIKIVPYQKGIKMIHNMNVIKSFDDPFDHSINIVVIKE